MKLKLLALVLALQAAWVLSTVFLQERGLATGVTILLETRPVDPRDLLRGDYVILNYQISTVPIDRFQPAITNLDGGRDVFVALEKKGEFHVVRRASTTNFSPAADEVVLRGKSRYGWEGPFQSRAQPAAAVRVDYGLERYYVGEGTGNPRGKLTVAVAVPASGRAQIKEVLLDGKPYAAVMRAQLQAPSDPSERERAAAEARARAEAERRAREAAEKARAEAEKKAKAAAEKK
ncbi:hypothetical protein LBMAG56_11720 [Verrucomicrobiota bacterium]|nr:hypothetical protein LBMAG56_11720 [Verrucomicrobiota bacterium]